MESFPTTESHWSSQLTKKQYLSHDLNIKMMCIFHTKECEQKGISAVKECVYKKTFLWRIYPFILLAEEEPMLFMYDRR